MQNVGGINLGFTRLKFTWCLKQNKIALAKEHLDRTIVDSKWIISYPRVIVEHLTREFYDHTSIFICTDNGKDKCNRSFCFLKAWIIDGLSNKAIKNA